MSSEIHVYLHGLHDERGAASVNAKLDRIITLLSKGLTDMAADLRALEQQAAANVDVEASAALVLGQIHALLLAAQNDPVKIQSLIDQLGNSRSALAAAIVENTPVAGTGPESLANQPITIRDKNVNVPLDSTLGSTNVPNTSQFTNRARTDLDNS